VTPSKRTSSRPVSSPRVLSHPATPTVRVRVLADSVIAMGPGKADLLEAIAAHGSISAAARAMGMSYRRAWLLVDTMNSAFAAPLVESGKGGVDGGYARLTPTGRQALAALRDLTARAERVFTPLLAKAPRQR
jgi:molybdate transport system regulatory protein